MCCLIQIDFEINKMDVFKPVMDVFKQVVKWTFCTTRSVFLELNVKFSTSCTDVCAKIGYVHTS